MEKMLSPERRELTISDARQHIEAVRGQIMAMGGNDSENADLNDIITALEEGGITAQEAVYRANGIRDSKQAYH